MKYPNPEYDASLVIPEFTAFVAVPAVRPDAVPVRFVATPLDGVPRAPPLATNAPAVPTLAPNAVTTPVPVVVVAGAAPAPPPMTKAFAVNAADDAQVLAEEKYGTPPDVPATVNARVPELVTGDPATDMRPPVNVCPTLVTVPVVGVAQVGAPAPALVSTWPEVPAASLERVEVPEAYSMSPTE